MNEQLEEIIRRALNGDKDAYTNLILSIENDLYRVAQARLDDLDDINDAIQETVVNSYENLKTLKNPIYFKSWITKILINECNMIYRRRYRQLGLFSKLSLQSDNLKSDKDIQNIESRIDFKLLIDELNYEEKLIITLFYSNRYSVSEISDILNMNVNTVKSKLLRAKSKLKSMYEKGGFKNESRK